MPSSESNSCSDTTDSHQVWTDSDEEVEVTSRRISRTNWEKGATIIDYIDGAVPERLKGEFWVVDNWLGSPEAAQPQWLPLGEAGVKTRVRAKR